MKRTLAIAVLSFAAGALWSRRSEEAPKHYVDTVHGFSLDLPRFDPGHKGDTVYLGAFYAPKVGGAAANVNVLVEHNGYSVADYDKITHEGLFSLKKVMNARTELEVDGRKALLFDYEGKQGEQMLQHLALAVLDQDRTLVATCTAPKAQFAQFEAMFRSCLKSFRLTGTPVPAQPAESRPAGNESRPAGK